LEGITAAQEALDLLLPAGDFTGALDVLCDLRTAGIPAHVAGLHAFKTLPQQLAVCEEVHSLCYLPTFPCMNHTRSCFCSCEIKSH
jgi:hypothetical protein